MNNRQSSPKYIYGESYSGIRVPILARLLEEAGTSSFEADKSGKPPVILSGIVLNSPILNYDTDCWGEDAPCGGYLPTYAMTADYYKKSKPHANIPATQYLDSVRAFAKDSFNPQYPVFGETSDSLEWRALVDTPGGLTFLDNLAGMTGVDTVKLFNEITAAWDDLKVWRDWTNLRPSAFTVFLDPAITTNAYDARMHLPGSQYSDVGGGVDFESAYDPADYENAGFAAGLKALLPDFVNYSNPSTYEVLGDAPFDLWNWEERDPKKPFSRSSIPDLIQTLNYNPDLKILVLHGYHDMVTPFHQTEQDLADAGLAERIPVKNFDGGHMTYLTEASRVPLKKELDLYYSGKITAAR